MTRKLSGRPPELLLALASEEFQHLCQQTLSAKTCRSYAGPLRLFQTYLRDALGREPLLSDFTLEVARLWCSLGRQLNVSALRHSMNRYYREIANPTSTRDRTFGNDCNHYAHYK
jgi:hypothetical protein